MSMSPTITCGWKSTLPWLLQRFAEVAQAAIRNRGKLLLTKRS